MSYRLRVLRSNPLAYWPLEEQSGVVVNDAGGNGYDGVYNNSFTNGPSIVGDSPRSVSLGPTSSISAQIPQILLSSQEKVAVAIECWIYPTSLSGTHKIAGRTYSGLFQIDNKISFVIENSDAEIFSVDFVMPKINAIYHVIAVYGSDNMILYVDGDSVGDNVISGSFRDTSNIFTVANGFAGYISNVSVYNHTFPLDEISQRYVSGLSSIDYGELLATDDAIYYPLNDETADLFVNVTYEYEDWPDDSFVINEIIDIEDLGVIDGSRINFSTTDSDILVETSLDEVIWNTAIDNSTIVGLEENVDTNEKYLYLRISHPDGTALPPNIHVVIYSNKNPASTSTVYRATLVEPFTLAEGDVDIIANENNSVARTTKSGHLVIPYASTDSPIHSVEFWIKRLNRDIGTYEYLVDARPTNGQYLRIGVGEFGDLESTNWDNYYINGSPDGNLSDIPLGVWTHIVVISSSPITNSVSIASAFNGASGINAEIAHLAVYSYELSRAKAAKHYQLINSRNTYRIEEASLVTLNEYSTKVYRYPWQIQGGGG